MTITRYATSSDARKDFAHALNMALDGRPVTVQRGGDVSAIVDAARLRYFLIESLTANVTVVSEDGGWSAFMEGLPISAEGDSFDAAIAELADALRDYADDWEDHLRTVPNHAPHWSLVQLVRLSDDEQLRYWLTRS